MTQAHAAPSLRAYLIDPDDRTIREVAHDGTLATSLRLLGVQLLDAVRIDRGAAIYIDDEGLLCDYPVAGFAVRLPGGGSTAWLAGRGLVVGSRGAGEDADAPFSLAELVGRVAFGSITEEPE